ncbi:MAG: hypothetical protein QG556_476 [Pseudomonadota bacterium]|nr:hypothetical protein [Pseudomonadota bacterium]
MSDDDVVMFRIEISRELGSISENLRRIDEHLQEAKSVSAIMWKKIDKNKKDIEDMKVKLAFISAGVSFIVANFEPIIKFFVKS